MHLRDHLAPAFLPCTGTLLPVSHTGALVCGLAWFSNGKKKKKSSINDSIDNTKSNFFGEESVWKLVDGFFSPPKFTLIYCSDNQKPCKLSCIGFSSHVFIFPMGQSLKEPWYQHAILYERQKQEMNSFKVCQFSWDSYEFTRRIMQYFKYV